MRFSVAKRMEKPIFNIVSFSGGKDSTAMLLKMMEENIPIDCVLFCDTGLEFPEMYEHIDKVEKETGIKISRVKAEESFEYMMLHKQIKRREDSPVLQRYGNVSGLGWPGPKMRWCTNRLKTQPRERFIKAFQPYYEIKQYVGIAADELYRMERKNNQNPNHIHPLIEWNMTEKDCLEYCYQRGYDWGGLYELFKRVSCWCCPLQSLEDNLHGTVNYLILPLFAFVNAGVVFSGGGELVGAVSIAVAAGLLLGKFIGIYFFTWLAIKIRLTPMPLGMTWKNLSGVALLGGIGFTVSLFIANLSFGVDYPVLLNQAKFGVLTGTVLSGLLGYVVLRISL